VTKHEKKKKNLKGRTSDKNRSGTGFYLGRDSCGGGSCEASWQTRGSKGQGKGNPGGERTCHTGSVQRTGKKHKSDKEKETRAAGVHLILERHLQDQKYQGEKNPIIRGGGISPSKVTAKTANKNKYQKRSLEIGRPSSLRIRRGEWPPVGGKQTSGKIGERSQKHKRGKGYGGVWPAGGLFLRKRMEPGGVSIIVLLFRGRRKGQMFLVGGSRKGMVGICGRYNGFFGGKSGEKGGGGGESSGHSFWSFTTRKGMSECSELSMKVESRCGSDCLEC